LSKTIDNVRLKSLLIFSTQFFQLLTKKITLLLHSFNHSIEVYIRQDVVTFYTDL